MKIAQITSAIIYLSFIGLCTILFKDNLGSDVTAIISMVEPVSIILPVLLTGAAIVSQFSAAVADTAGANGLMCNVAHHKISPKLCYVLIIVIAISITWQTNVNEIISYASRAFALFYALQTVVSIYTLKEDKGIEKKSPKNDSFYYCFFS